MKTIKILTIASAFVFSLGLISCNAQKKSVQADSRRGTAPFGETSEAPCQMYDTPEEFAATGIYRGSSYQKGDCNLNALANARQQVYEKYHHAYEGLVSNFRESYGNNRGNDIANKLNQAGDMALKVVLNDIQASCIRYSNVYDDGMIECYVGIRVSKGKLAAETAKQVANVLTDEEKRLLDFNEYKYRQDMEERLKKFEDKY